MDIVSVTNGALSWNFAGAVTPLLIGFAGAVGAGMALFVGRKILGYIQRHSTGGK